MSYPRKVLRDRVRARDMEEELQGACNNNVTYQNDLLVVPKGCTDTGALCTLKR